MLLNMRKVLYQEIINPGIILQKNRENEYYYFRIGRSGNC